MWLKFFEIIVTGVPRDAQQLEGTTVTRRGAVGTFEILRQSLYTFLRQGTTGDCDM